MILLKIDEVTRKFGGITALDSVSFSVAKGEIHALIGPNGSGKTTMFNAITGVFPPTAGSIKYRGQDMAGKPIHVVRRMGVARTFQETQVLLERTVLENVMMGHFSVSEPSPVRSVFGPRATACLEREAAAEAMRWLEFVGMKGFEREIAVNLPYGHLRLVEIARALAGEPELVLLDEPSAGMNNQETQALMGLIRRIRDEGHTVLLVEHNMRMVMGLSDAVTVLSYGKKICEGPPGVVQKDPQVIEAYLGKGVKFP